MPTPYPNEKKDKFIARCLSFPDMQKYDSSQRAAICYSKWDQHKKKSRSRLGEFIRSFLGKKDEEI